MTVYGYTRVSTERQADEGESLDVQRRQIGGYAMMKGLEIGRVFVERGVSGSTYLSERPQGAALLAALEPGDVVVTARTSPSQVPLDLPIHESTGRSE